MLDIETFELQGRLLVLERVIMAMLRAMPDKRLEIVGEAATKLRTMFSENSGAILAMGMPESATRVSLGVNEKLRFITEKALEDYLV